MNRTIEIIAMALGGVSLLTVCFLGFALMSGVPLHEVGVIGNIFEAPPEASPEAKAPATSAETPPQVATTAEQAIMNQAGLLHAWSMPSPFDPEELKDLTDSLKMRHHELDLREADLNGREARLDERQKTLEDRIEGLVSLQGLMDKQRLELDTLEARLDARQKDDARAEEESWASQARLLEGMESDKRDGILGSGSYKPEEMARILKALSEEARAEVMNGLQEKIKDPALLRSYLEAYGEIAGSAGDE